MNLLQAFEKIKSDHAGKQCLIARYQGPVSDNVRVCIRVKDGLIALSAFPITVYDMFAFSSLHILQPYFICICSPIV